MLFISHHFALIRQLDGNSLTLHAQCSDGFSVTICMHFLLHSASLHGRRRRSLWRSARALRSPAAAWSSSVLVLPFACARGFAVCPTDAGTRVVCLQMAADPSEPSYDNKYIYKLSYINCGASWLKPFYFHAQLFSHRPPPLCSRIIHALSILFIFLYSCWSLASFLPLFSPCLFSACGPDPVDHAVSEGCERRDHGRIAARALWRIRYARMPSFCVFALSVFSLMNLDFSICAASRRVWCGIRQVYIIIRFIDRSFKISRNLSSCIHKLLC